MNGSRSYPLRHGENPSIDALNRTIQGLEARIEGLMAPPPRSDMRMRNDGESVHDSVSEIMMRQKSLANSRSPQDMQVRRDDRQYADDLRSRAPMAAAIANGPAVKSADAAMQDIAQALIGLRHELKKDISEGVSREVQHLRAEIRGIKPAAPDQSFADGMRDDLAKLADSINRLGHQAKPSDAAELRAEFHELRSAIDGMAREDSVRHLENRWTDVEARLSGFNPNALQQDLLQLAYQLDDMKSHMGSMTAAPAIQALEGRLISLARQIESMGERIQPNDRAISEQFAGLDVRLDEISRAIAAANRAPATGLDPHVLRSFEAKINQLAATLDMVGQPQVDMTIAPRIEALAGRVEELLSSATATRLDERLDQLSRVMEHSLKSEHPPELASHLSDISRKIDALDSGSVNAELAKQLNYLARRIEEIGARPAAAVSDTSASMVRLEDRLDGIAARLDTVASSNVGVADNGSINHELSKQLNFLVRRIDEFSSRPPAEPVDTSASMVRLEDRLDDIAARLDTVASSGNAAQDNELSKQLNYLVRRIDDFGSRPPAEPVDTSASMIRLEDRLDDIAARLDHATMSNPDVSAYNNLEAQIANLSALLNQSAGVPSGVSPELEHRMAALEDYMATSDEFIMQAARQAAEAVAEAYNRNVDSQGNTPSIDLSTISALSEDLRHLEEMTRSSEQRTHKTFTALHDTLVQIANRLDRMESGENQQPRDVSPPAPRAMATANTSQQAVTIQDEDFPSLLEPVTINPVKASNTYKQASDRSIDPMSLVETARQDFSRLQAESEMQHEKQSRAIQENIRSPEVQRTVVQPPPATDAIESYHASAEDSLLLEPGSGVPDVKKILAKVRASQVAAGASSAGGKLSDSEKADFISAARRAAREAAAEIESTTVEAPTRGIVRPKETKPESVLLKNRKALMLTAGIIVLGVMSYPMLKTLVLGKASPAQTEMSQTVAPAAEAPVAATAEAVAEADAKPADGTATEATNAETGQAIDSAATAATETEGETVVEAAATDSPALKDGEAAPLAPLPEAEAEVMATEAAPTPQPAVAGIDVPSDVGPETLVNAARSGDGLALFEIGARYTDGRGVKADLQEAAKWYNLAAEKGQAVAQYRLANFYEKGTGVERDVTKAKSLYEQSAEQGNASAMHNLAVLAATGADGKPDLTTAGKWFKQAADMGVKDSQFNLAILYAQGKGVQADLTESYKWFAIAARNGDADAGQKRDEVAKVMKPDQLASAKAKVEEWKPTPTNDAVNNPIVPDDWVGKGNSTSSIDMKKAITNIQAILNNNGYDVGKPDGLMGAKTTAAIKAFQASVGQKPTGEITDALVKELLARNKRS